MPPKLIKLMKMGAFGSYLYFDPMGVETVEPYSKDRDLGEYAHITMKNGKELYVSASPEHVYKCIIDALNEN